jgi:hypothetical protein
MKPVLCLFLLVAALAVLIGIVGLVLLRAGGSSTVLLPGLGLVISMGVLLVILTSLETILILLTVRIWRS